MKVIHEIYKPENDAEGTVTLRWTVKFKDKGEDSPDWGFYLNGEFYPVAFVDFEGFVRVYDRVPDASGLQLDHRGRVKVAEFGT